MTEGMAQIIGLLTSKWEAMSSVFNTAKKKNKGKRNEVYVHLTPYGQSCAEFMLDFRKMGDIFCRKTHLPVSAK
jgi:hypothetical protein